MMRRGRIAVLRMRPAEALIACHRILDQDEIKTLHEAELAGDDVQITTAKGCLHSVALRLKRIPRRD